MSCSFLKVAQLDDRAHCIVNASLSPPAVHLPVSHLAGGGHQGNPGADSGKPFAQHPGQHLHLRVRGSRDFPHHQRPGPGGHPQRRRGAAEEARRHRARQPGRSAADQRQPAHAGRLTDITRGGTVDSPKPHRVDGQVTGLEARSAPSLLC